MTRPSHTRFDASQSIFIGKCSFLLPNHFHKHPLWPATVELSIENLFPRAEVEFPMGDGNDHFAYHHAVNFVKVNSTLLRRRLEVSVI